MSGVAQVARTVPCRPTRWLHAMSRDRFNDIYLMDPGTCGEGRVQDQLQSELSSLC